jgi:hypothetical protein
MTRRLKQKLLIFIFIYKTNFAFTSARRACPFELPAEVAGFLPGHYKQKTGLTPVFAFKILTKFSNFINIIISNKHNKGAYENSAIT